MNLERTDLVVMAACDTGRGEAPRGMGVFGLRGSFRMAGAKSVVMSLWEVPEPQTIELMDYFYAELFEGKSIAVSLRSAQKRVRDGSPHPYYWGGFVVEGDALTRLWE